MTEHRSAGTITHAQDHLTLLVGDMTVTVALRKTHQPAPSSERPVAVGDSVSGKNRRMSDEHKARIGASQKQRWRARREAQEAS
jgi:hypothetical protein